jgi:uncharacterized protein (DUF362 family)
MLRRRLLELTAAAAAGAAQKRDQPAGNDTAVAGATPDTTPRVGIVLSSFKGSEDHDGTKLKGLRSPAPPDGPLSAAQLDEMVRKAIELGNTRRGGLPTIVEVGDWVVVKPRIAVHRSAGGRAVAGSVADPRVVRTLIAWLAEHRLGKRITVAEGPSWSAEQPFDAWNSDWDGAFGKISYRAMVDEFARKHPAVRFDIVDLNGDETMEMRAPGRDTGGAYQVPNTLMQCDKLITVAPLATSAQTGVSLTLGSYLGALPGSIYGRLKERASSLAQPHQLLADLFSFHPADYAILGGEWGIEGDAPFGPRAAAIRHNLVLAGANAVAVDAVGVSVMGFVPSRIRHLELAAKRGLGTIETDSIWTRGNAIDEAKRPFRPAASG